jgi:antitoxin (DNA-binding transcriptional repressor) of toxin-antitoxin stability system
VGTLMTVTELPEEELREHPDDVLRRVKNGEEFILTEQGQPVADLRPHERPRSVGWEEFWGWPKADRKMLDDIRELRGSDTPEDWLDPWERYARRNL